MSLYASDNALKIGRGYLQIHVAVNKKLFTDTPQHF